MPIAPRNVRAGIEKANALLSGAKPHRDSENVGTRNHLLKDSRVFTTFVPC